MRKKWIDQDYDLNKLIFIQEMLPKINNHNFELNKINTFVAINGHI